MELWDILNQNGKRTGRVIARGNVQLKSGEYHLVVHIWPVNDYGSLLIQKRSKTKRLMPGVWAATGGAAITGESSFEAASRELYEELGIRATRETLKFVRRMKRQNSFVDIWTINVNVTVPQLKLQKSEVAEARWVNAATLMSMVRDGNYHNYGRDYFEHVLACSERFRQEDLK